MLYGLSWGAPGSININGIGSADIWQNELIRAGDTAGPNAAKSGSVLAATGFKVDDNTDLVVELPGRNFELTRSFQGNGTLLRSGAFGPLQIGGWAASIDATAFPMLEKVASPCGDLTGDTWQRVGNVVVAPACARDAVAFHNFFKYKSEMVWDPSPHHDLPMPASDTADRRTFVPMSSGLFRITADKMVFRHPDYLLGGNGTEVKLPVWRLTDPGGGTSIFFRGCPQAPDSECASTIVMGVGSPGTELEFAL